jgi:hypothetical protein
MGRFLPPDHSKGDERTLGGYIAVHDRPAAFEGSDGLSYSVSIEVSETGEPATPYGAYIVFVRWGRGDPRVTGHLETDFLARAASEAEARAAVGALSLADTKRMLDALIREHSPQPTRPWWEAMHDE